MCLREIDSKNKTKKIKDTIGRNGIKVYKIVHIGRDAYYPLHYQLNVSFKEGKDEAKIKKKIHSYGCDKDYQAGFHFWMKKATAKRHLERLNKAKKQQTLSWQMNQGPYKIIECIVKKSWIMTTGKDIVDYNHHAAIVTRRAIFPKFEKIG